MLTHSDCKNKLQILTDFPKGNELTLAKIRPGNSKNSLTENSKIEIPLGPRF
jgi:hypothetical protein